MLDMKSLSSLIKSSFIQLFCKNRNDDTLYQMCKIIQYPYLNKKYIKEFGSSRSPLVCACEKGRLDDVKSLITGYDGNGSNGNNMTLKEYVNQVSTASDSYESTPLAAAIVKNHKDIREYLLEHGADLYTGYKYAFPKGTPIVVACENGCFEDVKLLIIYFPNC